MTATSLLRFALLGLMTATFAAAGTGPPTTPNNQTDVTCTQSRTAYACAHSTGLFPRSVANSVAAACCYGYWYGGANSWGMPSHHRGRHAEEEGGASGRRLQGKPNRVPCGWTGDGRTSGRTIYTRMKGSFFKWGMAYAKVIAQVQLNCTNAGDDYECSTSKAVADAVAKSRAGPICKATHAAFDACGSCMLGRQAKAALNEALFMQLNVQASAKVTAKVCVGPHSTASAAGFVKCYGQAVARGFAKIIAEAMIAGDCFSPMVAKALQTEIKSDVKTLCACDSWVYTATTGNAFAQVDTKGTCDAYAVVKP